MEPISKPARGTAKAEETRSRILAAALNLFRERGFDQTTMRDIATAAGVAIGAAYYYFESKEALVMAFYQEANIAFHEGIEAALERKTDLRARLRAVIDVKFEYFGPNRKFLGALLRHAADPDHPLSPFSAETREIRELDMRHFSQALDSSNLRLPEDLRPYLPKLLWLYQMSLILFWIYDRSEGQARTERLLEKSLAIVVNLLKLSKSPFLRPVRRTAIELLQAVSEETPSLA
jgi:AcrR family transcriptional regulator